LARDRRVKAAKRCDGFDGKIGSEGQPDTMIEKSAPGVGVRRALMSDARLGPVHVGKQMVGLHRGNHSQASELIELRGIEDLCVLHAEAEAALRRTAALANRALGFSKGVQR